MKLCKIVGKTWSVVKDENVSGVKLLLARELNSKGELNDNIIVAADEIGAGEGDTVIITEGDAVLRTSLHDKAVDSVIIAIVEKYTTV